MRLDDAQFDQLMVMLDEVQAEYDETYRTFGVTPLGIPDVYEATDYNRKTATLERIRTEIIVRSGRLPEGSTF